MWWDLEHMARKTGLVFLIVGREEETSARTQVCAQNAFPGKGLLRQIPVPQVDKVALLASAPEGGKERKQNGKMDK